MMSLNFERKIIAFFPIYKQISVFCLIFALFCAVSGAAQPKHQEYLDYIERYKQAALQSEREYGVPASITLAQGILESKVGKSDMARNANNHFGIKAYHWSGEVYGRCDSLNQVGYRVYGSVEDSYLDHAKFLKGPRYSILYQFDVTDYRSWAQGLLDCGYAQDSRYPIKLINLIEQYELHAITNATPHQDGELVQDRDDGNSGSTRWHHRKRRDHSKSQPAATSEPGHERPQSFTPMRQGKVPSSADND